MLKGAEALVLSLSGAALRTAYTTPGAPIRRPRQGLDRLLDRAGVALRSPPTDGLALAGALGEALWPDRPGCVFTDSAGLGALLSPLSQGGLLNEYRSPVLLIELMEAPGPGSTPGGLDSRAGLAAVPLPVFEPGSADEVAHLVRLAGLVSGLGGLPVVVRVPAQALDDRCEGRGPAEGPAGGRESSGAQRASRWSMSAALDGGAEPPIFFSRSSWAYHHGRRLQLLRELDGVATALTATGAGQGPRGVVLAGHVGPLVQARAAALGLPTLRLGLCWPLPQDALLRFLRPLSEVLVLEEGPGFLRTELEALCQRARLGGQVLSSAAEQKAGSGLTQPGAASEGVEAALVRFALRGRTGASPAGEGRAGPVKGPDLEAAHVQLAALGPRLDERGELDLEPWGLYVARVHQPAVGEDEAVPGLLDLLRQLRQLPRQVVITGGAGAACEQALRGGLLDIRLHGGSAAAIAGSLVQAAGPAPASTSPGEPARSDYSGRSQAGPPLVVALIDGDGPLWEELLGAMDNGRQGRDVLHVVLGRGAQSAAVIEAQLRAAEVEVVSVELGSGDAGQVARALGYIAWRSGPRALCCVAPAV